MGTTHARALWWERVLFTRGLNAGQGGRNGGSKDMGRILGTLKGFVLVLRAKMALREEQVEDRKGSSFIAWVVGLRDTQGRRL